MSNPNNMTLTQSYEATRDLISSMIYKRSTTNVVIRNYSYDLLGRPISRAISRNGATQNDSFNYNSKSELISATVGGNAFSYNFDEIGNRTENLPNAQNQPTIIGDFVPAFDADGNMTSLQTSTGTWEISWNAENRATRFENSASGTVVECSYDSQGRRFEKLVSVAGTQISRERFIYRGFLQIAAFDVAEDSAGTQILTQKRTTFWDPTEPTATRPLALQIAGTGIYFPCVDLTKNACELVDFSGTLAGTYDYSPFGEVTASANVPANPFQWSSEFYDSELALVYYNYRHYVPAIGRWLSEDPIGVEGGLNFYCYCFNSPIFSWDNFGLKGNVTHQTISCHNGDSCPILFYKMNSWIAHYSERYQELMEDKYNYKKTNPVRYNNHIDKINGAQKNIITCRDILLWKIKHCQCGNNPPRVPSFYPQIIPEKLAIPEKKGQSRSLITAEQIKDYIIIAGLGVAFAVLVACPIDGVAGELVVGAMLISKIN